MTMVRGRVRVRAAQCEMVRLLATRLHPPPPTPVRLTPPLSTLSTPLHAFPPLSTPPHAFPPLSTPPHCPPPPSPTSTPHPHLSTNLMSVCTPTTQLLPLRCASSPRATVTYSWSVTATKASTHGGKPSAPTCTICSGRCRLHRCAACRSGTTTARAVCSESMNPNPLPQPPPHPYPQPYFPNHHPTPVPSRNHYHPNPDQSPDASRIPNPGRSHLRRSERRVGRAPCARRRGRSILTMATLRLHLPAIRAS